MAGLEPIKSLEDVHRLIKEVERTDCKKLFKIEESKISADGYWIKLIQSLLKFAKVPEFETDDREYDAEDFAGVADRSVLSFQLILAITAKYKEHLAVNSINYENDGQLAFILSDLLVFCAVHSDSSFLWTCESAVKHSQNLVASLCEIYRADSIEKLLIKNLPSSDKSATVYSSVIRLLKPQLMKSNWKKNPSVKFVFYLYLSKVRQLSEFLEFVLPVSLMMIDDYKTENKILGINSLNHIVDNSSRAELGWYGRVEVIYDALRHQMYTHEPPVVRVLHPCLLAVLTVVERSPKQPKNQARKWCRYDDVFIQLLQDMRFEHKIVLRRIYSEYLDLYIDAMGITAAKHTIPLTQVITDYLEQHDGCEEIARFNILSCLKSYIRQCWIVIDSRQTSIISKSLLQFVFDLSVDRSLTTGQTKTDLVSKASDCLLLLDSASNGQVGELFSELKNVTDMNEMCRTFIDVLIVQNEN